MQIILIGSIIILALLLALFFYSKLDDHKDEDGIGGYMTTIEEFNSHTYILVENGTNFAITHDPDCTECIDKELLGKYGKLKNES